MLRPRGTISAGKFAFSHRRVGRLCLLLLTLAFFMALGSLTIDMPGRAHAHPGLSITSALPASATPGVAGLAEATPAKVINEAPVPSEIPLSSATRQPSSPVPSHTATEPPREVTSTTATPYTAATSTPQPTSTADRWEASTLRDFAETVGWPPVVVADANDRLTVRKEASSEEWWSASIRPFSFRAGAEAAFFAEQEDARLSGFQLSRETFQTFPAYGAYRTVQGGAAEEWRYRWLVDSWILGIEVRHGGVSQAEVQALATQLLSLATQNGLPVPPGSMDPPTSTPQSTPAGTPEGCSVRFSDVPEGMWAYSYVTELACTGIVSGYRDGTFRPQNATTRAQLVKMVVLLEGLTLAAPSAPSFTDVGPSHTFYRYIETAAGRGMIAGYEDGTFRPDAPISRAQVAKIVVNARGWDLLVPATPATLCDVPPTHWGYTYVQVAIAHGIFTGYGDGCFRPDDFATRAQLAKVLVLSRSEARQERQK